VNPQDQISQGVTRVSRVLSGRPARRVDARRRRSGRAGQLLIIGGAEDRVGAAVILRRFRDLCGGKNARIAVLGSATAIPDEVGADYIKAFGALGVGQVHFLPLASRDEANAAETIEILEGVDGVFFTGGDQRRISTFVAGSRVDGWLHQNLAQGLVIAGTSAGAAMMSNAMIIGGSATISSPTDVELGTGLGFLPGVVIDQHFTQRARLNRLLAAVSRSSLDLGIGIDEDTALIVDGNRSEVLGAGSVTIVDLACPPHEAGATARIHVLATGSTFDLTTRTELDDATKGKRKLSRAS
jgi:cyanophycinase